MVSKIIKKTPIKPTKDRRTRRRKKPSPSPVKTASKASSIVITSINKSFFACQRRLVKIFTKLANIGTPNRRKGYCVLKKFPIRPEEKTLLPKSLFFNPILPPQTFPFKKTIFLDLDETLIHSKTDPPPERFDFVVRPSIEGQVINFYVLKRPGVDKLLESIGKDFEVVVFTAGLQEYASLVLDRLDSNRVISHRLYRNSCKELAGKFVKDLSDIGRDLKNVVLVDDNPNAYVYQPENALPVRPFIDDLGDRELEKVVKFFEGIEGVEDMRDAIKSYVKEDDFEELNFSG